MQTSCRPPTLTPHHTASIVALRLAVVRRPWACLSNRDFPCSGLIPLPGLETGRDSGASPFVKLSPPSPPVPIVVYTIQRAIVCSQSVSGYPLTALSPVVCFFLLPWTAVGVHSLVLIRFRIPVTSGSGYLLRPGCSSIYCLPWGQSRSTRHAFFLYTTYIYTHTHARNT